MSLNNQSLENSEFDNSIFNLQDIHLINTITSNSHDMIYFKDVNSRFLLISKAQAIGLGLDDPHDAIGKSDFDFFPEDYAKSTHKDERDIINTGTPIINRLERLVWPTGRFVWVLVSKYPLYGLEGKIIGTWGSSTDITELIITKEKLEKTNKQLRETNAMLEVLSGTDSLSGLNNYRQFFAETEKEYLLLKRRSRKKTEFSIVLLDIDNFKDINDTQGHLSGDFAIRFVAERIKSTIRASDKCYRYGGDEFIVLLPNTDRQDAVNVAEKIRLAISCQQYTYKQFGINITISAGVASSNEANNVNGLLEIADKRLYESKLSGRNKIS